MSDILKKNPTRVLVTGADGFIGSHLTELLLEKGFHVRALTLYNSFNFWGWLEEIPANPRLEIVSGDIRDLSFCKQLTKDIDTIFHLAALIAIPYSYTAPQSYIDTNVTGTFNICQSAIESNVKRIIVTSTSEVYGTANYVPIDEKHPLQPQSPYSASKIGADAIAKSFFNSFNLPLTIARPFNVYGPRQSSRAIIPTIITQIVSGLKKIEIGDLTPTRDFTFVKDTVMGFLRLAECPETIGETINIGSNSEISIHNLIKLISKLMNCEVNFNTDKQRLRPKNSEVFRLVCDNELMFRLTGFKPGYSIEQGLCETIEWFGNPNNLKKYKAHIFNV